MRDDGAQVPRLPACARATGASKGRCGSRKLWGEQVEGLGFRERAGVENNGVEGGLFAVVKPLRLLFAWFGGSANTIAVSVGACFRMPKYSSVSSSLHLEDSCHLPLFCSVFPSPPPMRPSFSRLLLPIHAWMHARSPVSCSLRGLV
eukprot:6196263-Pleurochrysis_carterae.AAC.1